ncbi:conserved hypothetical protein [Afipia carboxidovorans OM5]|uniref:Uncharacterized protein n=2 Tax=Afipia carboxidovorans TaxID=40137 RepID=B6JE93_AFIC5|nr:hypothetical protein [Afipia carboxidovorans]ACI92682.1 conserved hypothetical protein [Afipia carboxidovorans OM5]AEI03563.1 hypothetical protein OCA4_c24430 [Afipia carboxidovorans OM4]AEI07140.1 hypothetical protein OCA5_c24440 [Afipia carboxidovorans OM5]BEV44722.1 hypothetical protein CRBSH125_09050 [Afipia carboxidovorans]
MHSIENLTAVANAYSGATDTPLKTLSWRIFNDGKKLDAVVSGKSDLTTSRYDLAMQWFSDNWPPRCAWPKGIARPAKKPAEAEQ